MKAGRERDARAFACTTLLAVALTIGASCNGSSGGTDGGGGSTGGGGGHASGTGGTTGGAGGHATGGQGGIDNVCISEGQGCGTPGPMCCSGLMCCYGSNGQASCVPGSCTGSQGGQGGRRDAVADGRYDRTDGGTADVGDAGQDVGAACAAVAPLRLSNPKTVDGSAAPGQSATIQVTLTDTSGPGYTMYPDVVLSSSTPGVSIPFPKTQTPAVSLNQSALMKWRADFAPSLQSGTDAAFTAEVRGQGGLLICSTDDVLSFSLSIQ
jgi:hypothetical protein